MIRTKLALGSAQFGMDYGISNQTGKINPHEVHKILELCIASGVSMLDTSPRYGDAEKILGSFSNLAKFDVVTKLTPIGKEEIVTEDIDRIRSLFLNSLGDLKLQSAYGLLVHDVSDLIQAKGSEKLVKLMKDLSFEFENIKIGVSIYDKAQLEKILSLFTPDIVQVPINIYDQRLLRNGYLDELKSKGIEIHARSCFLQGLVFLGPEKLPPHFLAAKSIIEKFHKFCADRNISPLQASLSFVASLNQIDKVIVGVSSLVEFQEIVALDNISDISYKEWSIEDPQIVDPTNWPK